MARVKKAVLTGVTREQAEAAFATYATADAREQKLTAGMDEQITRIREKNQPLLQACAGEKESALAVMQAFAMENRELFHKRRSIETAHGAFGFRLGTPSLKTMKGFTWASVTHLLKEFLPDYVRIKEEPAKDLLLAAARCPENAALTVRFSQCGVYVDQQESFFVDPKKEEALS